MREPDHPQMGWLDRRVQEPLEEEDAVHWRSLDGLKERKTKKLKMHYCR